MNPTKLVYVIYWEKQNNIFGFVSYDNSILSTRDEYNPVSLKFASVYSTQKDAERTMNWYLSRGGFGQFIIMQFRKVGSPASSKH